MSGHHRDALVAWADTYAADKARLKQSRDELCRAVQAATKAGMSEVEAAELAGVTRVTIRAWLGKGARQPAQHARE